MASSSKTVEKGKSIQTQENPATGQEDFVNEPHISWRDHVLIPAEEPLAHAFLGPLPASDENEEIKEVFPSHDKLKPKIFDTEGPFNFEFLKSPKRVFRSGPRVGQNQKDEYIPWLNRIQAKKEKIWKEQGIFDLIQLSRYGPDYNHPLLLAAIHFWDISTHSLQLKCGMLSPTLFDIAAITGLKPLGEIFNPKLSVKHKFDFPFAKANFSPYIREYSNPDTENLSDSEYLAFLTLWLSVFVFCSRSIQVSKTFIPLAIQLHEGRNINLAQLILGTFHQGLSEAVSALKSKKRTDNLNFAGPMWLLHLWLTATFRSKLDLSIPQDFRPVMASRRTEGILLAQLESKRKKKKDHENDFSAYLEMFLNCDTFEDTMAPFIDCKYGPDWFKEEFPSDTPDRFEETNLIWQTYLSPTILSAKLSSSNAEDQFGVSRYFPSHFSRQFGLCQLRPAPVYLDAEELEVPRTEKEYKLAFKNFQYKGLIFESIKFSPRNACTKEFHQWWSEYFTTVSRGRSNAELLEALKSKFPSRLKAEEKETTEDTGTPKKKSGKASSTKSTKLTTKPKTKSPTRSTIKETKAETTSVSTPTSKKRKPRSPSPIARVDPSEPQPILSSSEESDDDDELPLIRQKSLQSILGKRPNKGIAFKEPQEQIPPKKSKPSGDQPKAKKIKITQTPVAKPVTESESTGTTSTKPAPLSSPPIQETPITDAPQEIRREETLPTAKLSPMEVDKDIADQTLFEQAEEVTPMDEQNTPSLSVEEDSAAADRTLIEELVKAIEEETEATTKDSTNSIVSETEASDLRDTDPATAFKLLMKSPISSTNLAASSSTTSLASINQETSEELLQQLKSKVLEGDFLAKIKENPIECFAVKDLICRLRKSKPDEDLYMFLMELNSILDTLAIEFKHHGETLKRRGHEQEINQAEFEALKATDTKIEKLEAQKAGNSKATTELNAKIQRYQDEIKELQLKLESAEQERNLLQENMEDPEPKIKAEALKGLKHLDNVKQQRATIAQLDEELQQVETSISAGSKILDRLKETLRNIQ